jgi:YedE family putative selenium metabolism protein
MIGALVFLGCPLRLMLRLGGGDLNAVVGLAGFGVGAAIGSLVLRTGFSLGQAKEQPGVNGLVMPAIAAVLLVFALTVPAFIKASTAGPGAMHAPVLLSLGAAVIVGALVQKSGLCMSGGIRNIVLLKNPTMFWGYAAIFLVTLLGNLLLGKFKLSFDGQPIAHAVSLWNFLGMLLVGYGSVLLGGCPLRQLVMSGEGNADAGVTVLGFLVAGGIAHNFGLAASAATAASSGGPSAAGKTAVLVGLAVMLVISLGCTGRKRD